MFKVTHKRCDQCLFSGAKIVTDARAKQVLRDCKRKDCHFICHKHTLRHLDGKCSEAEADVCCRGFYDRDPGASNLMRIAGRLGCVEFVDEAGKVVKEAPNA